MHDFALYSLRNQENNMNRVNKVNPKSEAWVLEEIEKLRSLHLDRGLTPYNNVGGILEIDKKRSINLASNDYLGFAKHPSLKAAIVAAGQRTSAGATASRLITGTLPVHLELEKRLAEHKGYAASLLFGSGFLSNIGSIPALVDKNDDVFADRLIHASMIDAIRLSGATLHRFAHNDPDALKKLLQKHGRNKRLVCIESVYSMDGDLAPLQAMAKVVQAHDAMWMVDEAHASGVFGPNGAGCISEFGLQPAVTIAMGTLSKAFGGYGGFIACRASMHEWLINRARSFIYTTALPPSVIYTAIAALKLLEQDNDLGNTLLRNAARFRNLLRDAGLNTMASESQIIPVLTKNSDVTLRMAADLRKRGVVVGAIRPPTVPSGMARLRLSITLEHTIEDLEYAANAIISAAQKEKLC